MRDTVVLFDDMRERIEKILQETGILLTDAGPLYLIRDLFGKMRIAVSDEWENDLEYGQKLQELASRLHEGLGVHAHSPERAVLFVASSMLDDLSGEKICSGAFWAERLVTGDRWWTVNDDSRESERPMRITLYSIKGGVGRSTTASILAWHLAQIGERVMVVDLDLESPGLSSAMLERDRQPEFGVVDWFVEDLVGQGVRLLEDMTATPQWAQDFDGNVRIVPAHGRDPGEYLAKLGRVYLGAGKAWTVRLDGLLQNLEDIYKPTIVLMESRSGLHDLAAATVTDLDAQVLLFAVDSVSTWIGYEVLFRHWRQVPDLARGIRDRLQIVSALTPTWVDTYGYLQGFREQSWGVFTHLYDDLSGEADLANDSFSFDLNDESGPHIPWPIYWNPGLATGASLRRMEESAVKPSYEIFLKQCEQLVGTFRSGASYSS